MAYAGGGGREGGGGGGREVWQCSHGGTVSVAVGEYCHGAGGGHCSNTAGARHIAGRNVTVASHSLLECRGDSS